MTTRPPARCARGGAAGARRSRAAAAAATRPSRPKAPRDDRAHDGADRPGRLPPDRRGRRAIASADEQQAEAVAAVRRVEVARARAPDPRRASAADAVRDAQPERRAGRDRWRAAPRRSRPGPPRRRRSCGRAACDRAADVAGRWTRRRRAGARARPRRTGARYVAVPQATHARHEPRVPTRGPMRALASLPSPRPT